MFIGMGGAGGKLATKLSANADIINVSQDELNKIKTNGEKILAFYASENGQLAGSRKNPNIGYHAYQGISKSLTKKAQGNFIVSSSGGGSGSGLCKGLLEAISQDDANSHEDNKSIYIFILPYAGGEALEYVENSRNFIEHSLVPAIRKGNTGNVFLFSNDFKYKKGIVEDKYNEKIVSSFRQFYSIPEKSSQYESIEGHIDKEDFRHYLTKSFYNHFTYFYYNSQEDFESQLMKSFNPLMTIPSAESWTEVLFLLEIPESEDEAIYYKILNYFEKINLSPIFSVVKNPKLTERSLLTISFLHLHHPHKEFDNFHNHSKKKMEEKVKRALSNEFISVKSKEKSIDEVLVEEGHNKEDVLNMIKRIKSQ